MPNRGSITRVICPFYLRDEGRAVDCEGVAGNSRIIQRFSRAQDKQQWMEAHCETFGYAEACPIAGALTRQYEAES